MICLELEKHRCVFLLAHLPASFPWHLKQKVPTALTTSKVGRVTAQQALHKWLRGAFLPWLHFQGTECLQQQLPSAPNLALSQPTATMSQGEGPGEICVSEPREILGEGPTRKYIFIFTGLQKSPQEPKTLAKLFSAILW